MADVFRDNASPRLDRLAEGLYDQRLLNRIGLAVIRTERQRTRRGLDADGQPFRDYHPAYAKLKDAADGTSSAVVNLEYGVRREGEGDEARVVVNKYDTMLTHLDHVVAQDRRSVVVAFDQERAARIARYHNVEGAGRGKVRREFHALSAEQEEQIGGLVGEHVNDLLTLSLE